MEFLKKEFVLIVCALFLLAPTLSASTGLEDILSGSSGSSFSFSGPSSIQTQTRGYYNFGGLSVRSDIGGSIRPFNIEVPRIASGCGGVDIGLGGFSFLNIDQLVEKLQKIASAAPAFAFNMALSALCKDCQSIMDQLNAIADTINGLNFDACKSAVGWGKSLGSALNTSLGSTDDAKTGIESVLKDTSSAISNWASKLQGVINCGPSGDCTDTSSSAAKEEALLKERFQGSFVHKVFADNSSFLSSVTSGDNSSSTYSYWFEGMTQTDAEALFRNMIGDFYGYVDPKNCTGSDQDGAIKAYNLATIVPQMSAEETINIFLGTDNGTDGNLKGLVLSEPSSRVCGSYYPPLSGSYGNAPVLTELNSSFKARTIRDTIKTRVSNILSNMRVANSSTLKTEAKFMSSFRFPIYRALNVASVTNDDLLIDYITDFIVSQELVGLINELARKERAFVSLGTINETTHLIADEQGKVEEVEARIKEINTAAAKTMAAMGKKMEERVAQISVLEDTVKRMKQELGRKGIQRFAR